MIRNILISAAVLSLAAPAAALAQSDWDYGRHQRDHEEHGLIHDDADIAHERAHDRGFYSRSEHEGYHEALRDVHREFHDDHPGTRHDGYRLPRENRRYRSSSYGYSPYGYSPYGYSQYGNSPYGYSPYDGGSVTFQFRR